jgi:hypothetical protein
MLKISITETSTERRMVLKGQMIGTDVRELRTICTRLRDELDGRALVEQLAKRSKKQESDLIDSSLKDARN